MLVVTQKIFFFLTPQGHQVGRSLALRCSAGGRQQVHECHHLGSSWASVGCWLKQKTVLAFGDVTFLSLKQPEKDMTCEKSQDQAYNCPSYYVASDLTTSSCRTACFNPPKSTLVSRFFSPHQSGDFRMAKFFPWPIAPLGRSRALQGKRLGQHKGPDEHVRFVHQ